MLGSKFSFLEEIWRAPESSNRGRGEKEGERRENIIEFLKNLPKEGKK